MALQPPPVAAAVAAAAVGVHCLEEQHIPRHLGLH